MKVLQPLGAKAAEVRILDVSQGGLKLRVPANLLPGTIVQIDLKSAVVRAEVLLRSGGTRVSRRSAVAGCRLDQRSGGLTRSKRRVPIPSRDRQQAVIPNLAPTCLAAG
jgi:hypothetical protein